MKSHPGRILFQPGHLYPSFSLDVPGGPRRKEKNLWENSQVFSNAGLTASSGAGPEGNSIGGSQLSFSCFSTVQLEVKHYDFFPSWSSWQSLVHPWTVCSSRFHCDSFRNAWGGLITEAGACHATFPVQTSRATWFQVLQIEMSYYL